jgi:hypothetical protein
MGWVCVGEKDCLTRQGITSSSPSAERGLDIPATRVPSSATRESGGIRGSIVGAGASEASKGNCQGNIVIACNDASKNGVASCRRRSLWLAEGEGRGSMLPDRSTTTTPPVKPQRPPG